MKDETAVSTVRPSGISALHRQRPEPVGYG